MSAPKKKRSYDDFFQLASSERDVYGATVTVRRADTDETRTIAHIGMTTMDAVQLVVSWIENSGDPWRVLAISTPATIQRDIFASRAPVDLGATRTRSGNVVQMPEYTLLGRIGRSDLFELLAGVAEYDGPRWAA